MTSKVSTNTVAISAAAAMVPTIIPSASIPACYKGRAAGFIPAGLVESNCRSRFGGDEPHRSSSIDAFDAGLSQHEVGPERQRRRPKPRLDPARQDALDDRERTRHRPRVADPGPRSRDTARPPRSSTTSPPQDAAALGTLHRRRPGAVRRGRGVASSLLHGVRPQEPAEAARQMGSDPRRPRRCQIHLDDADAGGVVRRDDITQGNPHRLLGSVAEVDRPRRRADRHFRRGRRLCG